MSMTNKNRVLSGDDMILPYYKIERTQEGKQFFFTHVGYFNFWDKYLIMNIGLMDGTYDVLVNRAESKFSNPEQTENHKILRDLYVKKSVYERKPEEMFIDFPELKKFDFLKKI